MRCWKYTDVCKLNFRYLALQLYLDLHDAMPRALVSLCDSDNEFDDDDDLDRPAKDPRRASVGTQWRDFFQVEEYD
ncbi:hypothetical protein BaRGS_00001226 [Batillaria attramentaria]|uniref:Uncharacterized protein n=1 Tax=Batillaria attramentaria TaxID=370345 RepID=A0ABD0M775_9CAEN